MEQKNGTKQLKKSFFNYPMFLFAILFLFNIRGVFNDVKLLFSVQLSAEWLKVTLFGIYAGLMPLLIAVVLWLERFNKIHIGRMIVGVAAVVYAVFLLLIYMPTHEYVFGHGMNNDFVRNQLLDYTNIVMDTILYGYLGYILLFNSKKYLPYYVLCSIGIGATLLLGTVGFMMGCRGLLDMFVPIVGYIALWYVPVAFSEPNVADFSAKKGEAWGYILASVLILIMLTWMVSGDTEKTDGTCGSCGRKFSAGDGSGNYVHVAMTGLCNNCDENREYFSGVFD